MVLVEEYNKGLQIQLLPNRSATWQQTLWVLSGLNVLTLVIALLWALQGLWMVIPFAGMEVLLTSYLVYRVMLSTYSREVLYIEPGAVRVEGGISAPAWSFTFDLDQSEFTITNPRHSLSPYEVQVDTPGRSLRIGRLLNQEDSNRLVELIRRSGARYRVTGRTLVHAIDGFDL